MMGVGGGSREDPLFGALKQILPDVSDAEHIFQAAKNNVEVFVTSDKRTIIRFASEVFAACGVKVLSPTQFAETMDRGNEGTSRDETEAR
jgi:hypothetical protein